MITILCMLLMGIFNLLAFFMGVNITQKIQNKEEVKLPEIKSPMQIYKEYESKKKEEMKDAAEEIMLNNVEIYDGTPRGQTDVPDVR